MVPELKALAVLAEDWNSIPSTHMKAHNLFNSNPKGSYAFLWPLWVPDIHVMHIHTYKQTLIHKYLKKEKKRGGNNVHACQHHTVLTTNHTPRNIKIRSTQTSGNATKHPETKISATVFCGFLFCLFLLGQGENRG